MTLPLHIIRASLKIKHILETLLAFFIQQPVPKAPVEDLAISVVEVVLSPKEYAKKLVTEKWGEDQWPYFDKIISRESHNWTVNTAHYPTGYTADGTKSSAHGLGGFLDRTWGDVGCAKTDDMYEQIRCTVLYIEKRPAYGTPQKAWEWHLQHNWY